MNILFLIPTLGLGGAEKQLVVWAELLQKELSARVSVASFDASRTTRAQALERLGVPVLVLGTDQNMLKRIGRVVSFARQNKADIVHAFSCYLSPLALSTARLVGATPASSFRGDGLADIRGISPVLRRPTLDLVKYFTGNSREALARVRPYVRRGAVLQYVPNLVSPPNPVSPARPRAQGSGNVIVLAVGRLDENKRLNVFLDALATARQIEPTLMGVIAGDGPIRAHLTRQAQNLGLLPDGATFLGEIPDTSENYACADIFVHLAKSEGTPNVVLEAMAAGLPVVTTAAGDLRHIVRPLQTGCVVPFDDPSSVTRHLIDLARSPDLRARLGAHAKTEILESHSAQRVGGSLTRFYSAIPLQRG